jgi:hypothetical protein
MAEPGGDFAESYSDDSGMLEELLVLKLMAWMTAHPGGVVVLSSTTV